MRTTVYYLEYPPFSSDGITILTQHEYWQDLPANYHYERVVVGEGGEYASGKELEAWINKENHRRAYGHLPGYEE